MRPTKWRQAVPQAAWRWHSTSRLTNRAVVYSPERIYRRSSPTIGLFTTTVHLTRQSLRPREEAMRHALLPSSESHTSRLNRTVNGQRSAQHASQIHQHRYENCAAFFVPRAKVRSSVHVRPSSLNSYLCPTESDASHSLFLFRPLTSRPSIFCLRGVACLHETWEGRASACSTHLLLEGFPFL